jgi:methenyltetrahydromethanopterin cyclohydrolase
LKNNPVVKDVEVLFDHGMFAMELVVLIGLDGGKKLVLTKVNTKLKGDIQLMRIDKYAVTVYYDRMIESGYGSRQMLPVKFIAEETEKPLDSVNDIIAHYDVIYTYIDSLEDEEAERYAHINKSFYPDWAWDEKWRFKKFKYDDTEIIPFKKEWCEKEYTIGIIEYEGYQRHRSY